MPRGDDEDQDPLYVDEDHQRIAEFAADFLDEDERDDFVNGLMTRRGYQRIESWGPRAEPEPEPDPEPEPRGGGRGRGGSTGSAGGRRPRGGYLKR